MNIDPGLLRRLFAPPASPVAAAADDHRPLRPLPAAFTAEVFMRDQEVGIRLRRDDTTLVTRHRATMEEALLSVAFWGRIHLSESELRAAVPALARLKPALLDRLHATALGNTDALMRAFAEFSYNPMGRSH